MSQATYYNWKAKYEGMEASDIKRLKDLEDENRKLKQMYPELPERYNEDIEINIRKNDK